MRPFGDAHPTPKGIAPLLRWAGSKRKLLPELVKHVPSSYGRYIEPFGGSACLFFALQPAAAILSDLNPELIQTYSVLKSQPKLLHRTVATMPQTEAFYYELRAQSSQGSDTLLRAARFVYLNRNCFNGVYRTNRQGHFNVPRGQRPGALPDESHFLDCAKALKGAELISGDFEAAAARARHGDFVYLDPPYAKRGSRRRGEYGYGSFDVPDLDRLAQCLQNLHRLGVTFLLSYVDCPEIQTIAAGWSTQSLVVRRHVAGFHSNRGLVTELLVSNRSLVSA
jgi:DNA adenine methylase